MVLVKWFIKTSVPQIIDGWVRALLFFTGLMILGIIFVHKRYSTSL